MLKIDPKVTLDYSANVLPRKTKGLTLGKFDQLIDRAVSCANNDDKKGLQSAMELIGRLMTMKKSAQELADYAARLRAKGVNKEEIKYIIARRLKQVYKIFLINILYK